MLKKYPVLLFKEADEKEWGLAVYDLPINLVGAKPQTCLDQVQEAFEEFLIDEKELPEPTDIEMVILSERGQSAQAVMLVEVETSFFSDPTKPKTLSAKQSEWDAIDRAAKRAGKKRAPFMIEASLEKIKNNS